MAANTPSKLLPARARLSTALQSVALRQFTRDDEDDDPDTKKKRKRSHSATPPKSISAALQQLIGRF